MNDYLVTGMKLANNTQVAMAGLGVVPTSLTKKEAVKNNDKKTVSRATSGKSCTPSPNADLDPMLT